MRREYALLAYFDYVTELKLKQLWAELHELGITDYGVAVKDRRPHITLADYQDVDIELLSSMLQQYFPKQLQVPIHFNVLGSFIGNNMLYLAPTITRQLLDLHRNYHENFKQFNLNPNSYYLPDCWVPHCTIAGRLTDETILQVFSYCKENIPPIKTKITEVGLVEVIFDDQGVIVNDRLIMSAQLKPFN